MIQIIAYRVLEFSIRGSKVAEGDIIWAPAGEEHWHGAAPDSEFTHISITRSGTKLTQLEK